MTAEDMIAAEMIMVMDVLVIELAVMMIRLVVNAEKIIDAGLVLQDVITEVLIEVIIHIACHKVWKLLTATFTNSLQVARDMAEAHVVNFEAAMAVTVAKKVVAILHQASLLSLLQHRFLKELVQKFLIKNMLPEVRSADGLWL